MVEITYTRGEPVRGELVRRLIAAMIESARFYRTREKVLFQVAPRDIVGLSRVENLDAVLSDPACGIRFVGDEIPADQWRALMQAVKDHSWRLPPAHARPEVRP